MQKLYELEATDELIEMMLEENDKRSKMNIASYPIIQAQIEKDDDMILFPKTHPTEYGLEIVTSMQQEFSRYFLEYFKMHKKIQKDIQSISL